jgi:hypothetical protein
MSNYSCFLRLGHFLKALRNWCLKLLLKFDKNVIYSQNIHTVKITSLKNTREDLIRAACKFKIDLMKGRAGKKYAYRYFDPQG